MLFAEKESNIINMFQMLETKEIMLLPMSDQAEYICQSILNDKRWAKWIDSSAKNAPPPDFYNDSERLMMDVMRVDDHGFKKKGKIINPTYSKEHQLEHDLQDSGIMDIFPNAKSIIINADSGLPTEEDHNYKFYCSNFARTVDDHKSKIDNYQINHPGFKTIFFIFDESSAYIEADRKPEKNTLGGIVKGRPHLWFVDKRLISTFANSAIDYVIWYAPYKMFEKSNIPFELPKAVLFDCNCKEQMLNEYNPERMISSEV